MKATELRIGNYAKGLEVGLIRTIGNTCAFKTPFSTVRICTDDLEPIVLNAYWLGFFGFNINLSGTAYWNETEFLIGMEGSRYFYGEFVNDINGEPYVEEIKQLDYVHQLQNLHFLLTGEELKSVGKKNEANDNGE